MASPASTLPPPPGASPAEQSPTSPAAASPAPAAPSPGADQGTQMLIQAVHNLRALAKAYPSVAPEIQQINDIMRSVGAKIMQSQQPAEPQAPPQ